MSKTAITICCILWVVSCALARESASSVLSGAAQDRVNAALDNEGRAFTLTAPGLAGARAGWSVMVERGGKRHELVSAAGQVLVPAAHRNEATPYGRAEVTETIIRFGTEQVDLLFRLGRVPGMPGVLAQAGIRNIGQAPISLVAVTPLTLEGHVKGNPAEWLITELGKSVPNVPASVMLSDIVHPHSVFEYGGFYRHDGIGFLFGPVGEPVAYVAASITRGNGGQVSFRFSADMSRARVDPGETRWGQQVVLLMEPPPKALARWAEWVGKTHGARTSKGSLSGWGSWYFLGDQVTGKDVLAAVETAEGSAGRLQPEAIQIDDGYQDREGKKDTNERFPDGLTAYAHRISNAGARPGLYLHLLTHDGADIQRRIREARQKGFTYFKLRVIGKHFQIGADTKKTSFEICRESFALLREAAGEDAYLLICGENTGPNRAAVGLVDACRTGDDAGRDNLTRAIPQVLRSYQLQGRWLAVDNDAYYMGTDVQNVSEIKGGWPLVRTWASMVGLSCGAAFTSDPWYWESFKPYWRKVETMTPPAKERTEVLDLCTSRDWPRLVGRVRRPWGEWTVALLWNPGTTEQSVTLDFAQAGMDPEKRYTVWSFWDNRYLGVAQGSWTTPRLAPYACQHLSFTELDPSPTRSVLIGSDLHIYCGAAELKRVTSRRGAMTIELTDAGAREGDLFIYSRYQPILSTAVGCTVSGIGSGGENVWRITLSERQRGSPQRIELELLLPVTRQLWFWLVLAIVTGSLLLVAWQYMAKLRLKRAHDLEQERGRIARDIHDDLGASLTQIALLSELAQADLHEPEVARGHVNEIFNMARTLTRSVDEIVWAVNPANDTVEKFAAFIGQYVERFTRTSGLTCQLEMPDELPAQPMESALRHHLFLATKEALHNVSAHAEARTVRLDLSLTGGWLKLVIADDGRGFPPETSGTFGQSKSGGPSDRVGGGQGLSNMRQRMMAVGGTFEIQSVPGQGTRVILQVKVRGRGNT